MARSKCPRTNKNRFESKLEADLAIARVSLNLSNHRRTRQRDEPRRSYQCEFCQGWHMSSQQKRTALASQ